MSTTIAQNIEALCQEQGIDRELVVEAIKEAVRAAAKKQFKGGEDIQVDWSPESGLELSASKVVVDDVANADGRAGPHRGANRQTNSVSEGPRCGALERLRTVHRPRRRTGQWFREA